MEEVDIMTAKQLDRLADWLKSNGHTAEEVLDCLKYIAQDRAPAPKTPKKKNKSLDPPHLTRTEA